MSRYISLLPLALSFASAPLLFTSILVDKISIHSFNMHLTAAATLLLLGKALASPIEVEERQTSCPNIHVFGARETTAPAGYGTAGGKLL